MWPAKESASNNNLQTERKYKMRLLSAIFLRQCAWQNKLLAKHRKITLANIS